MSKNVNDIQKGGGEFRNRMNKFLHLHVYGHLLVGMTLCLMTSNNAGLISFHLCLNYLVIPRSLCPMVDVVGLPCLVVLIFVW